MAFRFVGTFQELMRILGLMVEVENERKRLQKGVKGCPVE